MPGWWKAFGLLLCEELREDLIKCNYLYKFRFVQIKEKFGSQRMYFGGIPKESNAFEIIDKYEYLSNYICQNCGRPDTAQIDNGWIMTICEDCYNNMILKRKQYIRVPVSYDNLPGADEDHTMPNKRVVQEYSKGGSKIVEYDIYETVNAIRNNWRER